MMDDVVTVKLEEGLQLIFEPEHTISVSGLFLLTWSSSVLLNGKPVCCHGFLPGATLWISSDFPLPDLLTPLCESYWAVIPQTLLTWMDHSVEHPSLPLLLPCTEAYITLDQLSRAREASAHFYRQYPGLP